MSEGKRSKRKKKQSWNRFSIFISVSGLCLMLCYVVASSHVGEAWLSHSHGQFCLVLWLWPRWESVGQTGLEIRRRAYCTVSSKVNHDDICPWLVGTLAPQICSGPLCLLICFHSFVWCLSPVSQWWVSSHVTVSLLYGRDRNHAPICSTPQGKKKRTWVYQSIGPILSILSWQKTVVDQICSLRFAFRWSSIWTLRYSPVRKLFCWYIRVNSHCSWHNGREGHTCLLRSFVKICEPMMQSWGLQGDSLCEVEYSSSVIGSEFHFVTCSESHSTSMCSHEIEFSLLCLGFV